MAHIFNDYLTEDYEVLEIVVEKNTKKAVNETIKAIDSHFNQNNRMRTLFKVDATIVRGLDKIASLVAHSLHAYRNFGTLSMKVTEIHLHSSYPNEFTELHYQAFHRLRSRGGNWESYTQTDEVINWVCVNACLKEELAEKLDRLKEVEDRYKASIETVSEEIVQLPLTRKWHFQRYSTSLLSLYDRCFDEVSRILNPSLQYNPSPSFQRDLVWSVEKKQSFIESIINEIPIGSFYVNVEEIYDPFNEMGEGYGGLVWDGKQRLHALHSFILGEFKVEVDGKLVSYLDAPGYFKIRFDSCGITVFESRFNELKEVIYAYVIINQAQVKHTDEDLQKAIAYLEQKSKVK